MGHILFYCNGRAEVYAHSQKSNLSRDYGRLGVTYTGSILLAQTNTPRWKLFATNLIALAIKAQRGDPYFSPLSMNSSGPSNWTLSLPAWIPQVHHHHHQLRGWNMHLLSLCVCVSLIAGSIFIDMSTLHYINPKFQNSKDFIFSKTDEFLRYSAKLAQPG